MLVRSAGFHLIYKTGTMDFLLSTKGEYLQRISYRWEDGKLIRKGQNILKKVKNEREMEKYRRYWKLLERSPYKGVDQRYLIYGIRSRQGKWYPIYHIIEYSERNTYRTVGYYKKEV